MRRWITLLGAAAVAAAALALGASAGGAQQADDKVRPELSGAVDLRDADVDAAVSTGCPQAGLKPQDQPRPLFVVDDKVSQVSNTGDDQRINPEYSCHPQDETSIDVNPLNARNAVSGQNDYRLGFGTSGVNATTDNGNSWYTTLTPFPSVPGDDHIDGGGDPAIVFDRAGVVYYAQIRFEREYDRNGIFVNRSYDGGFTWSRPCAPIGGAAGGPPPNEGAVCGGAGDVRKPGDGTVIFWEDPDRQLNFNVPFEDKEYIAAGPRPAGVAPVCFTAVSRAPTACAPEDVGVDRIYVTWTRFDVDGTARIMLSFSDDQARSWSPPRAISGNAPFCVFGTAAPNDCDSNQFSTPTVHPATGLLGVSFENFNTPDENQYLFVRSRDGGQTFEGPFFITPVFDANYPRSGQNRRDCTARGQGGRNVLTNSCFRVNSGGNVVVDPRGGEFADDFYLVMSDNRNGTRASSNTDTFLFVSKDGGSSWIGPTRVNDDPSEQPANRNCGRSGQPPCPPGVNTGVDQWFPWVDVSTRGDVNVNFYDRRLDPDSVAHEWPTSRSRPGNYLVWRFGGICSVTVSASRQCIAPTAGVIPQPPGPINPGNEPFPEQRTFPFRNFSLSDVPSNWDYTFRAGIFAGDYDVVAIGPDYQAWAVWTDARNGRSSRQQPGRNPICEQSDAFVDLYSSQSGGTIGQAGSQFNELFLVTPCPTEAKGNN